MYLEASSLVKTSLVQKIVFAVIRSATCFKSSAIVVYFIEVGGLGGVCKSTTLLALLLSVRWGLALLTHHLECKCKGMGH